MKLIVKGNNGESDSFFKEIVEVRDQYELKEMLQVEQQNGDLELILEEPEINFTDSLVKDKILTKDQIKELIEQLFGIEQQGCSTSSCNTCSSGC